MSESLQRPEVQADAAAEYEAIQMSDVTEQPQYTSLRTAR